MQFNGAFIDGQLISDLFVQLALEHMRQYLALAGGHGVKASAQSVGSGIIVDSAEKP